jgi:hypothetical protein
MLPDSRLASPDPTRFGGVSMPLAANVPCTPHRAPADLAFGGSSHADTINSYPTSAACFANLRDHVVRLMKRRECYCLRRRCDG